MTTETISLVRDDNSGNLYYQVASDETNDFYLCDEDGDRVQLASWTLVRVLGQIESQDSDAFFSLVAKSASEVG